MKDNKHRDDLDFEIKDSVLDSVRQWGFYAEFRIDAPGLPLEIAEMDGTEEQGSPVIQTGERHAELRDALLANRLITELATCVWYLKTKHFKREWDDVETRDDDPRVRRALSRLSKSIDTLKESGIEVHDPTNKRYPPGGEGLMRPIQFLPTAGLTFEVVSETVAPIIYRNDRLIQRGEVFIAVPREGVTSAVKPSVTTASPATVVAVLSGTALSDADPATLAQAIATKSDSVVSPDEDSKNEARGSTDKRN